MRILGLSAHYHDASAALLVDGRIVAAAQEERFSRVKHDASFPAAAARWCLSRGGLAADDLDAIAWYEKPFRKLDRVLAGFVDEAPRGLARFLRGAPAAVGSRPWVKPEIERVLDTRTRVYFLQHHESHAAAAYGPSPFADAAVLTLDGVGEWTTNALWRASGSSLAPLAELRYPHSLGLLYSAFTAYCGFAVNDGEYKLMGLAPYGEPRHVRTILDRLLSLRDDGSYALAPEYFAYRHADAMTAEPFHALFGGPPRRPGAPISAREADLARSIQVVTEEIVVRQARFARERTGAANLCLAGGVALNCVANGRLLREGVFDRLWIQPAAGDAGAALGAAYALWFRLARPPRTPAARDRQEGSLLGPEYSEEELRDVLEEAGCRYRRLDPEALADDTAAALAAGEVVGWFQGRMEYGPRALGNRSILADPRDRGMQRRVNLAVKFREGFRPFAPVVLDAAREAWFDLPAPSPYMLVTAPVRAATPSPDPAADLAAGFGAARVTSPVPAVTHVDGSARVQTLAPEDNPLLASVLDHFAARTGCPVLLNTSFNVNAEPIVCSPRDAYACFCRTAIDRLVLGPFVVHGADRRPLPAVRAALARRPGRAALEAACAVAGCLALLALGARRAVPAAALAIGLALAALRVAAPAARERLERALAAIGRAAAAALVLPVLALLFLAAVTPAGVVRRLRRGAAAPAPLWTEPAEPDHDPSQPY